MGPSIEFMGIDDGCEVWRLGKDINASVYHLRNTITGKWVEHYWGTDGLDRVRDRYITQHLKWEVLDVTSN